eukprot:5569637-Pyramimonas_sp.AAC.1
MAWNSSIETGNEKRPWRRNRKARAILRAELYHQNGMQYTVPSTRCSRAPRPGARPTPAPRTCRCNWRA